jgi:hypothetical protein
VGASDPSTAPPAMLSASAATRIFVALEPVDMRQSFNGLFARVQAVLKEDPTSGHFFLFTNKNRNRLKIPGLHFTRNSRVVLATHSNAGSPSAGPGKRVHRGRIISLPPSSPRQRATKPTAQSRPPWRMCPIESGGHASA